MLYRHNAWHMRSAFVRLHAGEKRCRIAFKSGSFSTQLYWWAFITAAEPNSQDDMISCVWNFATVRRLHCLKVNRNGLTDSSEWLYQTTSKSSITSLKRTSFHAWAQDLELNEDPKNYVLNCLNPVLLRLHNALLVRSHIKLVMVNLFHWPRSKKNIAKVWD